MMRRYACLWGFVAAFLAGCDDDSSSSSNESEDSSTSCTVDVCKDANTLNRCSDGKISEEPCGAGRVCSGSACIAQTTDESCSADVCLDATTLKRCENGKFVNEPCGTNRVCSENQCVTTGSGETTGACKIDRCRGAEIMQVCENGDYVDYPCGTGRSCSEGVCVPDVVVSSCVNTCVVSADDKIIDPANDADHTLEEWGAYHACVNDSVATETSHCDSGQICLYGGCVDTFSEKDTCEDEVGTGYCTADGMHAVVCNHNYKKTIWTCAAPCSVDENQIVNCPKTEVTYEPQCEKDYKANCYNDGKNVHVCVDHQIESWTCYEGTCAVDENNAVTCPRNAGVAGLGGIESGGTYGDMCNVKKYQEACIDNYFARICDADGYVRIKPAGDCKISSENPLKVEYTDSTSCDTSNYMPFCINDGKAIGFCAYDGDDLSVGVYKAAQCPNCASESDAEACMYL